MLLRRSLVALLIASSVALAQDDREPAVPPPTRKPDHEVRLSGSGNVENLLIEGRRAYVAYGSKVVVVDLDMGVRVGEVAVADARGVAVVTSVQLGFASADHESKLVAFDLATFEVKKEIPTGDRPRAVLRVGDQVWCFNHRSGTVTCVDPKTLEVVRTIEVKGELEGAVADAARGLVFVCAEDPATVFVIDVKRAEVTARWPTAPAKKPSALALDAKRELLYVAASDGHLLVMDAVKGAVLESHDIGDRCETVAFDPATDRLFASCDGMTCGFYVEDRSLSATRPIETTRGARHCAVDPVTHRLYVATGSQREARRLLAYETK